MKTLLHNQLNFGGSRTSEINFENVYQNKKKLQLNCFSGFKIFAVLFILLNLFAINNVVAQTKTWDGSSSTSWTDSNNWTPSGVPTSVNDVIIPNVSQDPRYDGTSLTVKSITVQNGGNLVFQRSNNYSLTVTNNVDVNAGGTFNIRTGGSSSTSTLTIGGNLTNAGTMDFTDGTTGVVNITFNSTSQIISGAGTYDWNNVTTSGTGTLTLSTSNVNLQTFTLSSGKTFALGTNTFTVSGNWTNNGGTVTGTGIVTLDGTGTIGGTSSTTFPNLTITGTITQGINTSVTGNYSQTAGTYNQNSGATGFSLTVSGNFSLSNATYNMQTTSSGLGATTTVNGTTGTTISGTASLKMDSGGAAVANVSIFQTTNFTSTATTSGTGNGIIDFGNRNNTKNNEFRVSGNFSKTGTTGRFFTNATPVNGGFVFNGSGSTQTVSIVASSSTEYYNVTVNTGAVVQLTSALTLGTASNPASSMTVNGTLDAQTFSIVGGNSGVFALASGSTLKTANVNGVVSGTIGTISTSVATRTFNSAANYIFDGAANQTANFGNTTINNLTISNTAGSVTLNAAITANDITINSGGGSLTAGTFTHLVAGNWTNDGGTFLPGTGTISLNGTSQIVGGTSSSVNFNNLSLSGGTKSFNKQVIVSGNLSIASGALANPGSLTTHTAVTLTLGGITTAAAKFGSTSTLATPTVYKTDTYFTSGTTGYITVSTGSCTTAITVATIASNNANTSYAKNGDVITISFTASETPSTTPTAIINGSTATVSGSGTSYTATRTVSGDTNGLATFSLSIQNAFGCTATRTTVTNASSVTVDTVAPTIPTISIASNNANTSLAKSGNVITLTFTTSETPSATPVVTINGASATVSGSGTSYAATRTVAGGDTNGVAPFLISIRDTAGNTTLGTATTNSSSVTVDTAAPTIPTATIASNNANTSLAKSGDIITLSFTTSETPASTPVVAISGGSASVSGSGTSYTATRTVIGADTNGVAPFSISIADAAGNPASRTTTTDASSVTIDTSAPTIPTATIASNNANTSLAKSGDIITLSFITSETPAATPVVTINGASASVSGSGTSYTATKTVVGVDTNGVVTFIINIEDAVGNSASRTTTTNASSVTIDTVAPTIPIATIASNNANTSLAKSGDIITLSFITSETPAATPAVTINGASASVSGSGTSWAATKSVVGGDTNGLVTFTIGSNDAAGNSAVQTATTNASSVIIDTVVPTFPSVTIVSNNVNTTVAGTGDVITLSFTTSETPLTTPIVTIDGASASVSGSGISWTATKTVANCSGSVVIFSISLSDAAGNFATTSATTDGSQVTINPTPSATIISNGGTICAGLNATFIVNGSNGATLNYTITGQPGTQQLALTGVNQTITASNATSNVTLTLTSVVNANCTNSSFVTGISTVTVNALPIVTASNVSGCSNTNIALIGSPVGGSFSISNPYNGTSDTTYTYSYTDGNGCTNTSSSANVTITTEINFNNIDDDCDGSLYNGHAPVVVDITTPNGTLSSMSTINSSTATNTTPYSGASVTYKFKVTKTNAPTSVAFVSSNTTSFTFSSASNAAHSSSYDVQATAIVNGEEQPYNGNTTSYTTSATPILPNPPTQAGPPNVTCVYTLARIDSYIYANNTTTYGANRYEFLVERMDNGNPVQTISIATTVPYFKLTNIVGIPATMQVTYGTTYRIKVRYGYGATSFGSQIYTAYGSECLVSTPALPVASIACGTTLASVNAYVYASGFAAGASQFEFKVTRVSPQQPGELPIGATTEEILPRNVANFKLTMLTSLFVGLQKEYSVAVRYTVTAYGSSNVSSWGTIPCSLFTPDFPETTIVESQCGVVGVPSSANQYVYATGVPGATQYRFRLYNAVDAPYTAEAPYDQFIDSPNNYIKLNQFPSLIANVAYSVTVVAQLYGEYANIDLAKDCSITAPEATPPPSGPAKAVIASVFQASAYPNPFANNFMIAVKTGSQSVVSLKVYDMIGRLIEQRESTVSDLETTTIGDRYPSGVYNVIVSQQDKVQTLRVVKR